MAENIRSNSATGEKYIDYGDKWQNREGEDLLDWLEKGLVNVENVINAYDKQIAKPVKELEVYTTIEGYKYLLSANCPNCNKNLGIVYDYCPNCGQHLEWDSNKKYIDDIEKSVSLEENT